MSELESWIRLAKLESPRSAVALADHFGSVDEVFRAEMSDLAHVRGLHRRTAERVRKIATESVENEIEALERVGGRIVTYRDDEYPPNLKTIPDFPPVLFVRGQILEQDRFGIAIVGTRRPSEYGKSMTTKLSRDLAKRGLTIVSGGARGVDTAAHTAAIACGGRTIAVMGSGLDVPYPYENRGLLNKIAENGAVVTEFAPGTQPDAWRFPVRNRLVSGMCLGVVVIESLAEGGAMITATLAAEQGREVWAVPGSTDTPQSEGPHRLIREGAGLVEKAEEILEDLHIETDAPAKETPSLPPNLTPEQKAVIQVLSLHPKHVDEIISECKLTPAVANSTLTLLEMLGVVRRVPGNSYVRVV